MSSKLCVTQKLIGTHLVSGEMKSGDEIGIKIDQALLQDATGTLVMLELEAMGLKRIQTELAVQYVDHNLIQEDYKNADDHLFLLSAARRFGFHYCRPGTGVSHPVHQECFGKPGKTLLGSDSHTPAAGAIGMLAIGAGGVEVATALAGEPFYFEMPTTLGVKLTGELPKWVSAKDIILEMLRRLDVNGGVGKIIEYYGPGLNQLSAMDRHVIANMGAETGATTSVFPSDQVVKRFLQYQGRDQDWSELIADDGAIYDSHIEINLKSLEPLCALPSSPGNIRPVHEVAGRKIYQSYIGSSANPGFRDFAMAAEIVKGQHAKANVSLDINPTSRDILEKLTTSGHLGALIQAGARIHQAGCNGCIGMGQAPATNEISLRTVPRNFPGRSGTKEDQVYLVSPETASASVLTGVITDPRTLEIPYPNIQEPPNPETNKKLIEKPLPLKDAINIELNKGPNIALLPIAKPCADNFDAPVLLKLGNNISTDSILPAGARVLPLRSNIPEISNFVFEPIDPTYPIRAKALGRCHAIVAGENYGQGSSREHAALAPKFLGLDVVIAKNFARIHYQNLINFGVLPLMFSNDSDYSKMTLGSVLRFSDLYQSLRSGNAVSVFNIENKESYSLYHTLSHRQLELFFAGGLINWMRRRL